MAFRFERRGNDLHTTVYLTLLESLIGFTKSFPSIKKTPLLISRTSVTHDGEIEAISGYGMPIRDLTNSKSSVNFGFLYITYRIQFPVALNDESKNLIKKALEGIQTFVHLIIVDYGIL